MSTLPAAMYDFIDGMQVHDFHLDPFKANLDYVDTILDGLETSVSSNSAAITDINAKLGGVSSGSPVHTRLNTLETRTTDVSGSVGIGNQRLSDRLGAGVTNANTAAAQLAALQAAVGIPWTGAAALGRIQALEGVTIGQGQWQAQTGNQNVAYAPNGSLTTLLYNTAVTSPVGLTMNTSNGQVTVGSGYQGWYLLSAQYDLACSQGTTHQCVLSIVNADGSSTYGADTQFMPTSGWSSFNATAMVYLAAAAVFKATMSVHTANPGGPSGNYTNAAGPGISRTHLRAVQMTRG